MQTMAVLFRGLQSLTTNKPLQLDPMSTMVSIATIPFRSKGTKLTFDYEQSTIDFLPPSSFQGAVRSVTRASKFQLAEIKDVALAFVATYNTAHPHIAFLLAQAVGGLQFLAESCYDAPEDRLVKHCLEYYQLLLQQAVRNHHQPHTTSSGSESEQPSWYASPSIASAAGAAGSAAAAVAARGGPKCDVWSSRDITMAVLTLQQIRDLIKSSKVAAVGTDLSALSWSQQEQVSKWLSVLELLVGGSHTDTTGGESKRTPPPPPPSPPTLSLGASAAAAAAAATTTKTESTEPAAAVADEQAEADIDGGTSDHQPVDDGDQDEFS